MKAAITVFILAIAALIVELYWVFPQWRPQMTNGLLILAIIAAGGVLLRLYATPAKRPQPTPARAKRRRARKRAIYWSDGGDKVH